MKTERKLISKTGEVRMYRVTKVTRRTEYEVETAQSIFTYNYQDRALIQFKKLTNENTKNRI